MTPYDKVTGRLEETVEEQSAKAEKAAIDSKLIVMRADWLRHPITLDFLHTLTEEYNKLANQLVESAAFGKDATALHLIGARANKLKEIIDYARRD